MRALIALTMIVSEPAPAAPGSWIGSYVFEQPLGRDQADAGALVINHRLVLGRRSCLFVAEGYQTNDRMRCTTLARGGAIAIRFAGFEDSAGANVHRTDHYQPGETLFTLERRRGEIVTYWHDYARTPDGPRSGHFFVRRG